MLKNHRSCTRRAFVALGAVSAAGAVSMGNIAQAAGTHPRIAAAITALEDARGYLKAAPHNFRGHKKEAVENIDKAIGSLKLCL